MYVYEDYLAHYQVKGAKHGVRRYQNLDGSLTAEGRIHYGIGPARGSKEAQKNKEKKERVSKRQERKAAKKEKAEAKSREDMMNYLRDHPKKAYKYRKSLNDDDLRKLATQIEFDRKLKDIRDTEIQRGWDKVARMAKNANTIYSLANTAKNSYNLYADVKNMLVDSGKSSGAKVVKIGEKQKEDKDKKD